jgi:tetratricopeptide (TPR) repeat protein
MISGPRANPVRLSLAAVVTLALSAAGAGGPGPAAAAVTIDYPEDGSIFPPEITPPMFLWRDDARAATSWKIDVSFPDGSPALHAASKGPRPGIGVIDPDCVADTNEPPKLPPKEAAAHSWTPDPATWAAVKRHSIRGATVTISGYAAGNPGSAISQGSVRISTSRDPVGAPIFYRDVPLMPSEVERGVIKPLAAGAIPLVAWRLRNIAEPSSRVVMQDLPVCANCHSFSADGKTMGMDMDGLQNNRGLYILARVAREMSIRKQDMIQWSTAAGALKGSVRVGFMSQVSPDGQFVVTTLNPAQASGARDAPSNYYVANFKDYRFLQVFYPTRGVLNWYSKTTGVLQPLPGADDPRFVQMGAVWSPDGKYLVFARAPARDPETPGVPLARFANDPNELPMQYDLYRIPFRDGKGGRAEPLAGAGQNGLSNSFPKVSPDGRWIVFVKSRNGLLMRPDSQLYIVPAAGGQARRMRCNTALMNSWHSFSPNSRWLVFSSKSRSPYTQMYLTHIDDQGNDSPAILIDNATAANRAVNLPEFVNLPPGGLEKIGGPALEYYQLVNSATYLQKRGRYEESAAVWAKVLEIEPDDAQAHANIGRALLMTGHREEAGTHLQKAEELKLKAAAADRPDDPAALHNLGRMLLDRGRVAEAAASLRKAEELQPSSAAIHCDLAETLLAQGRPEEALAEARKGVDLDPRSAPCRYTLGVVLEKTGDRAGALRELQKALDIDPQYRQAHDRLAATLYRNRQVAEALAHWREGANDAASLRQQAWVLATDPEPAVRNGHEAIALAVRAVELSGGKDAAAWDALAAAYAEAGKFADAALTARRALAIAEQSRPDLAGAIRNRIALYGKELPFRDNPR